MSNLRTTKAEVASRSKSRLRNQRLIVGGALACTAIVIGLVGRYARYGPPQPIAPPQSGQIATRQARPEPPAATTQPSQPPSKNQPASDPLMVDDDGKTLWASPTNGEPLDLAYLSPGAQIIVAVRPAELLKHSEGEKVRAALGPLGQAGIEFVEQVTGVSLADMDRLVVGCQVTSDGSWFVTLVIQVTNPISKDALLAKLPGAVEKDHSGKMYWLANERAYYLPDRNDGEVLVVAPEDAIRDVIDLAGQTPPLRRDIERLIAHTDNDRHATILLAPNSLFSEGQSIFAGQMTRLRGPLFWFLGDELSGAVLSMHWDDNFFLELMATPTLETSPEKAARIFAERVGHVPDKLEEYVIGLNAQPYGRHVVARFPEMVRKLASYTRSGFEKDYFVLRSYLPAVAGHNLLMAAELTLAEAPSSGTPAAEAASPSASTAANTAPSAAKDRLVKVTSLRFARDTLEAALEQLSQDIGVPIVIRGPDLQAEGITKNQSFGIDVSDKPAEQILVEILRLANPDKSSTGPSDQRQKLVYIVEQKPDKTEQIVITTRAKVKERKDELPAVFRMAKP